MQDRKYDDQRLDYSAWHRHSSICRYISANEAKLLSTIDLDMSMNVEYADGSKQPIALIELAQDVGQSFKTATVTVNLAKRADLPCYVVLYELANDQNPADTKWKDIKAFRIKRLYPEPEKEWRSLTPKEYARGLLKIREFGACWTSRKQTGHR